MLCTIHPREGSRKGAEPQRKVRFFAPLRLCGTPNYLPAQGLASLPRGASLTSFGMRIRLLRKTAVMPVTKRGGGEAWGAQVARLSCRAARAAHRTSACEWIALGSQVFAAGRRKPQAGRLCSPRTACLRLRIAIFSDGRRSIVLPASDGVCAIAARPVCIRPENRIPSLA